MANEGTMEFEYNINTLSALKKRNDRHAHAQSPTHPHTHTHMGLQASEFSGWTMCEEGGPNYS